MLLPRRDCIRTLGILNNMEGRTMNELKKKQSQNTMGNSVAPATSGGMTSETNTDTNTMLQLQSTVGNHAVSSALLGQDLPATRSDEKDGTVEAIKEKYFSIVDKGEDHYMEAIDYLIDTFKLDASHVSDKYYDDSISFNVYAETGGGEVGEETVHMLFGPRFFDKNQDFGAIVRGVAHDGDGRARCIRLLQLLLHDRFQRAEIVRRSLRQHRRHAKRTHQQRDDERQRPTSL
jgi:hypothetical protein